jgi:hypothetical protein
MEIANIFTVFAGTWKRLKDNFDIIEGDIPFDENPIGLKDCAPGPDEKKPDGTVRYHDENAITDVNYLSLFLAGKIWKPLLDDDEVWHCYGYAKRPKRGSIWHEMFPKKFELENFIVKEILTMSLIDVLNGVKKSTKTPDTKLLISIGVIDQFLPTIKHIFSSDSFMENLFSTYASYLKSNKSELHIPVILKAKNILDKKDFAKFMVGTIKLLSNRKHAGDFLWESAYIKSIVEKSIIENKLRMSMSAKIYKKYLTLLSEKIFNENERKN